MAKNTLQDNFALNNLTNEQIIRQMLLGKVNTLPAKWLGGAVLAYLTALSLGIYLGSLLQSGLGHFADIFIVLLITALLTALTSLIFGGLLKILHKLPAMMLGIICGSAVIFSIMLNLLHGFPSGFAFGLGFGIVFLEALLGGSLFLLCQPTKQIKTKMVAIFTLLLTLGANIFLITLVVNSGTTTHLAYETTSTIPTAFLIDAPNPATVGGWQVNTLFYGSGNDKHRFEFGKEVGLTTTSVDVSPFLNVKNFQGRLRKWYWGFDITEFPLNGRVWYPEGTGSFPLVLIVHGNHKMEKFSDAGYAYLGKLLASRGFITVSIDENFLNGNWAGDLGTENQVRAWILLQHLKQWQTWNIAPENPFFQKVDLTNIALIGHSRGGEAAAIATAFNKLSNYPDNANIKFNFNFSIKSVVALAPSDGQYQPANRSVPLENVNYLVLQGGHDSDVYLFAGQRQYQRVKFTDGGNWFKSSLYIYQANHSQFNTVWGEHDLPGLWSWLINTRPLLKGEEQRQIAQVYISAFLEATLHNNHSYLPIFRDYRQALSWLPQTIYVNQYLDSRSQIICNFEEDINPVTTTIGEGYIRGERFSIWREQCVNFRSEIPNPANNGVYLSWANELQETRENKKPYYTLVLPDDLPTQLILNPSSTLTFALANLGSPTDAKTDLDLTIELVATNGSRASIPLSYFGPIHPVLKTRFFKWNLLEKQKYGTNPEPLLQTYELSFAHFIKQNPQFNPTKLKSIRFIFDQSQTGTVIIDDIGFRNKIITLGYYIASNG